MKHDGQEVWSKMDEKLLKEIALTTSGAYIPAKTRAYDLGQVYSQHLAGLTRGEISAEKRKRYRERFQLFVVLGLAALLLEMVVPRYPRVEGVGSLFRPIATQIEKTPTEQDSRPHHPDIRQTIDV
jgi:Ca-activated chloride channel family protein